MVGHIAWIIVKGPLEALVGILYGIVFGCILWYIPHNEDVSSVLLFSL